MHRNYGEGAQLSASPAGPMPLHRRLRATWGRGAGGGDQIGPLCKCGYGRLKKEARWVALFHWIHPGVAEDQQSRLLGSQCRMEDGHEAPGDPPQHRSASPVDIAWGPREAETLVFSLEAGSCIFNSWFQIFKCWHLI